MCDLGPDLNALVKEVHKRRAELLINYDDGEWRVEVWAMGPHYTEECLLSTGRECAANSAISTALRVLSTRQPT